MRTQHSKSKRKEPKSRPAGSRRGRPRAHSRRRDGSPPPARKQERAKRRRQRRHRRPPLPRHAEHNVARPLENVIRVNHQSIHNGWKRELGGLIRWYANLPLHQDDPDRALATVESLYRSNRCDVEATKHALLEAIATAQGVANSASGIDGKSWIALRMVVKNPHEISTNSQEFSNTCTIDGVAYETVQQGRGTLLPVERRPGEGPAHASKIWNVVKIPDWAVNRPYYFEVVNRSSLDMSCEMSIDGHSAAKNAPIPALERRTIQPAAQRYFESHEWRLAPATRIPLQQASSSPQTNIKVEAEQRPQQTPRYNERRPNYNGERVSECDFPDPSEFGWIFTGSNVLSKVEFFEKRLNNGSVCKMDFYYTTATVKTVLYHPLQQQSTQLFRRCLQSDPAIYLQILKNPRYHSNLGYTRQRNIPPAIPKEENTSDEQNDAMLDALTSSQESPNEVHNVPYFAKNDDYAFDTAGHENRKSAMSKLQPTREFKAWEQATKQDWACIHAKFFVSMRRYLRSSTQGPRKGIKQERIHLPEMKPVIQVLAAQNAVIATRFHSTGPSSEPKRKSRVRMERVSGLNDDPEWGTGPVFDVKLYYRLETALASHGGAEKLDTDEAMIDSDDEGSGKEEVPTVPLAEKLRNAMPLEEYKKEKIDQLHRWYQDCKVRDHNEGNARVRQTLYAIGAAGSTQAVDECLKDYWDWHMQQELSFGMDA